MYKSAHSSVMGHDARRGTYTPRRRGSSYRKKPRQGRRTKLTDELLQSISEIVAVTEILSISHLNKELECRGYSLSRSTVFRAMESLGLKADRDKKIWRVGAAGADERDDQQPVATSTDDVADSKTDVQPDEQHQTILTNANSFCVPAQDNQTYLYSLKPPWILEYPPSSKLDFHGQPAADGDGELETAESSHKPVINRVHSAGNVPWQATDEFEALASYPTAQEGSATITLGRKEGHDHDILPARATFTPLLLPNSHAGTSKLDKMGMEIGEDQSDPQCQEMDSRQSTCTHSSASLTGAWAESRRGLGRAEMPFASSSQSSERRGRKRKSHFPAKLATSTAPPQSNTGQSLETVSSCTDEAIDYVDTSGKASSIGDHRWVVNGSDKFHRRLPCLQDTDDPLQGANGPVLRDDTPSLASATGGRTPRQILRAGSFTPEVSPEDSGLKSTKRRKGDSESKLVGSEPAYRVAAQMREVNGVPHRVLERGGAGTHPGDSRTANHEQTPDQNHREHVRRGRENPQRARLHALTSNLAAKTWANAREMSVSARRSNVDREFSSRQVSLSPEAVRFHLSTSRAATGDQSPEYRLAAADDQRRDSISTPAQMKINGPQRPLRSSSFPMLSSHDISNVDVDVDDDNPESPTGSSVGPLQLHELRHWMQGVFQKLTSMDQQLQYLTQVVVSLASMTVNNRTDGHEQQTGATSAGSEACDEPGEQEDRASQSDGEEGAEAEDRGEGDEKGDSEIGAWGDSLPPVNTPQSDDMISKLLDDGPWDTLSPFIGGPRLAIRLARDCIFGPEVLSRSTVTGRNGMNPLERDGIKKIKDCLMDLYGENCSDVERELLWKMTRESLSQLCKRTRRQLAAEDNDPETDSQDDTP